MKRATKILAIALILLLTSCTTWRKPKTNNRQRITPPDPYVDGVMVIEPVKAGERYEAKENGVFMPFWYFLKLFDYVVDTQAEQEINN